MARKVEERSQDVEEKLRRDLGTEALRLAEHKRGECEAGCSYCESDRLFELEEAAQAALEERIQDVEEKLRRDLAEEWLEREYDLESDRLFELEKAAQAALLALEGEESGQDQGAGQAGGGA